MAKINLNSEENRAAAEDRGAAGPLPAGEYVVDIYNVEVGSFSAETPSGKAGHEKLTLTYKVSEGDFEGRKIRSFNFNGSPTFASGAVNYRLVQLLTALGFEGEVDVPEGDDWEDLVGESVGVRLVVDPADPTGRIFNSVNRIIPVGEVKNTPTRDSDVVVPEVTGGQPKGKGKTKAKGSSKLSF
jgi:hypothetical protein